MAFDACGTTKLEGEEIIKRLAEYLEVDPKYLEIALKVHTTDIKALWESAKDKMNAPMDAETYRKYYSHKE